MGEVRRIEVDIVKVTEQMGLNSRAMLERVFGRQFQESDERTDAKPPNELPDEPTNEAALEPAARSMIGLLTQSPVPATASPLDGPVSESK